MIFGTRLRKFANAAGITSAVLAILTGGLKLTSGLDAISIQQPPPGFRGFWDPPSPPSAWAMILMASLFAAGVFHLFRAVPRILSIIWTLVLLAVAIEIAPFFDPAFRAANGFRGTASLLDLLSMGMFDVSVVGLALSFWTWHASRS